jgi:hypothetical protein
MHTVIDLSPYQGHYVQLRFRLGTDSSTNSSGWWVDDIDAALSPEATTGDPSSVTTTAATVAGAVSPHSTPTSFHVEYGPTSAYGAVAPAVDAPVGSDAGPDPVSQAFTGLAPATTYHYRVVATFAGGSSAGADKTFTTAAAPAPDVPVTPVVPAPFGGMLLSPQTVKPNKRGKVKLTLACPAAAIGNCVGTDKLTAAVKVKRKRKTLTLGTAAFSIAPGTTGTVTMTLSRAARTLLARKHSIQARRTVVASDSRNARKTTMGAVRLKVAARKH